MVRHLRRGKARNGLILANGGVCTYQYVMCFSAKPRKDGTAYPETNPIPPVVSDWYVPPVDDQAEGDAVVEVSCTRTAYFHDADLQRHIPLSLTEKAARCEDTWLVV